MAMSDDQTGLRDAFPSDTAGTVVAKVPEALPTASAAERLGELHTCYYTYVGSRVQGVGTRPAPLGGNDSCLIL